MQCPSYFFFGKAVCKAERAENCSIETTLYKYPSTLGLVYELNTGRK